MRHGHRNPRQIIVLDTLGSVLYTPASALDTPGGVLYTPGDVLHTPSDVLYTPGWISGVDRPRPAARPARHGHRNRGTIILLLLSRSKNFTFTNLMRGRRNIQVTAQFSHTSESTALCPVFFVARDFSQQRFQRSIIAASICDRYSVGPSIRPICTR